MSQLSSSRTPAGEPIGEIIEKAGAQLHQRESPRKGGNQHRALVIAARRRRFPNIVLSGDTSRSSPFRTPSGQPMDNIFPMDEKSGAQTPLHQRGSPRKAANNLHGGDLRALRRSSLLIYHTVRQAAHDSGKRTRECTFPDESSISSSDEIL